MRLGVGAMGGLMMSGVVACAPAPTTSAVGDPATVAPASVMVEDQELLATVQDVDMESRILTLRRTDGTVEKIYVPADVRNLTQVRLGDQVVVSHAASLVVARAAAGAPQAVVDSAVMRTPEGSMPGIAAGSSITTLVTIENYDPATQTVTFIGPNGTQRMAQLERSEMQDFAGTLKKGDQVEVTYSEAAAITIQPPGP
ncbi:MAG TPA: hypothetical protein VHL31_13805 [Geminicoccus sp.]|jgi:hypothetical protein|uniref:hypothetical protein n=1 Tax=Geminicoccus sp. TaxID=2024832 RepID=UPI002E369767|nr:hypothetical protein [Geminicoccus sp.]HEX2527357.1 hypothetical protein [Geminicoccus sp.]